jgi:hypothetical protein
MTFHCKSLKFQTIIYKIWMMRHGDVPDGVSRHLSRQFQSGVKGIAPRKKKSAMTARSKYIPVVAAVNGCSARVTLMPAGCGRYRIQLNTALRKAACADVGDVVSVELRLDRASREVAVPADLRVALKQHPKARHAFEALRRRRHFIEWFDSAKGDDTRIRRLGRAIDVLLERALLRATKTKPTHLSHSSCAVADLRLEQNRVSRG